MYSQNKKLGFLNFHAHGAQQLESTCPPSRPQFSSKHPHWIAHNHLFLCSRGSSDSWRYPHTRRVCTDTQAHTHKIKYKKQIFKRKKSTCLSVGVLQFTLIPPWNYVTGAFHLGLVPFVLLPISFPFFSVQNASPDSAVTVLFTLISPEVRLCSGCRVVSPPAMKLGWCPFW